MILADTSAWIEYDRATGSVVDERLTNLIASGGPLAVTEPVVMEVLAGATSDAREDQLRRALMRHHMLPFDPGSDFDGALRIFRRCRARGFTPRAMIDCMIAAVAWRSRAAVLTQDRDLVNIAGVVGIELDAACG